MKLLRPLLVVFGGLSLITGLAYPLLTTGAAQALFPFQANGGLLQRDGKVVGSRLIGQNFTGPQYFWGRPSATGTMPYNAGGSSGSNLGPTNPAQLDAVKANVVRIRAAHPAQSGPVPVDLVTASASGLDPEISAAAAFYQLARRRRPQDGAGRAAQAGGKPGDRRNLRPAWRTARQCAGIEPGAGSGRQGLIDPRRRGGAGLAPPRRR